MKVGARALWGAQEPRVPLPAERLQYMSTRHEAIVVAVALAMLGDSAEAAYLEGRWDPAGHVDGMLGDLAPDRRRDLKLGILLLEEWTLGLTGFSRMSRDKQVAFLTGWKTSSLAVHRTIWGSLHAATVSSFTAVEAGSKDLMGHPGPCISTGRPPGQTVAVVWDEAVP